MNKKCYKYLSWVEQRIGKNVPTANIPELLTTAIKGKNLIIFVGNGVSRLSGVPGWHEILVNDRRIRASILDTLKEANLGYTWKEVECAFRSEIAYLWLKKEKKASLESKVSSWNKKEANLVHYVLPELQPKEIITTNFDNLLEKKCVFKNKKDIIIYLHKKDGNFIFTIKDYFDNIDTGEVQKTLNDCSNESVFLFIGYGHHTEDLTIALSLYKLKKLHGKLFSLIPEFEMNEYKRTHLDFMGIKPIPFRIPKNPDREVWEFCLANALFSLVKASGIAVKPCIKKMLQDKRDTIKNFYKYPVLSLGLVSINRLSVPETFPIKSVRMNLRSKREEIEEIGGPAYHVCRFLSSFGLPSALLSVGVLDKEGETVLNGLKKTYCTQKYSDFNVKCPPVELDLMQWVAEEEGVHSWHSFVIVDEKGQRVFIDNHKENTEGLIEKEKVIGPALDYVKKRKVPIVYFDKFLGNDVIGDFLKRLNNDVLTNDVLTVYETGSRGSKDFELENNIKGCVNIVLASYRFATLFFLKDELDRELKSNLKIENLEKTYQPSPSEEEYDFTFYTEQMKAENDSIETLIKEDKLQEKYFAAIREKAKQWLRKSKVNTAVVITLHGKGCLWLLPNVEEGDNFGHISIKEKDLCKDGVKYTNSAGDVFRAVFVAALRVFHEKRIDFWNKDSEKYNIEKACEIANEIAALKACHLGVHEILEEAQERFYAWKGRLG